MRISSENIFLLTYDCSEMIVFRNPAFPFVPWRKKCGLLMMFVHICFGSFSCWCCWCTPNGFSWCKLPCKNTLGSCDAVDMMISAHLVFLCSCEQIETAVAFLSLYLAARLNVLLFFSPYSSYLFSLVVILLNFFWLF